MTLDFLTGSITKNSGNQQLLESLGRNNYSQEEIQSAISMAKKGTVSNHNQTETLVKILTIGTYLSSDLESRIQTNPNLFFTIVDLLLPEYEGNSITQRITNALKEDIMESLIQTEETRTHEPLDLSITGLAKAKEKSGN